MRNRKQALAEAREARKNPPLGQRCQCRRHKPLTPSVELKKVYFEVGGKHWDETAGRYVGTPRKLCYEWWCIFCYEDAEIGEWDEGWPVGDDGKFMTPVQCEIVPGLD